MKKVIIFLFSVALVSCQQSYKIDEVVITSRLFSPDSSYVALEYYFDNGAMGESSPLTSVIKVTDTTGLLNNSTLPCLDLPFYACYYPDRWLNNTTLQVWLNERPFVREGMPFDSTSVMVNGITCKVIPFDYSYNTSPLIEYFNFSADEKKILVAYRYRGELNISAINYGEKLPRIGNVFANTEISFNPIIYAKWNGNEIDMYLKDANLYKKSDYINKKISYTVNFVDASQLDGVYGFDNARSHFPISSNSKLDGTLNNHGVKTPAKIIETQWSKSDNKSQFYYEYAYNMFGQTFRSYFRIYREYSKGEMYKKGDTVNLLVDPKQPFIHKTENNYGR